MSRAAVIDVLGSDSTAARAGCLVGQGLTLGIILALLLIIANTLFLTAFGSAALPYVYIAVAFLGAIISFAFTRLQRRWALSWVVITTTALTAFFFFICWIGLAVFRFRWFSFALITAFPLLIQIGFIMLGSQAGRLLDVRQIKRLFGRVVAGFVVGFIIGGAMAPVLVGKLGGPVHVIPVIGLVTLFWLALQVETSRRFAVVLSAQSASSRRARSRPLLLGGRFVQLLVAYQMLGAMVMLLSDFLVLREAGERYASSTDLAQFFGNFTVLLNTTDLLFLLVLAGIFLNRFGLRGGLLANPLAGTLLFTAAVVVGFVGDTAQFAFFALVVVARIMNITLTDGTTRTSINAAYQAVPASDRILVQTGAEGVGVPIALGVTGLLLLVFAAGGILAAMPILLLTVLLALLWVATSLWLYRGYAGELGRTIRRRALGDPDLLLADRASLAAIERLLESDEPPVVALALDALETIGVAKLNGRLLRLVTHPKVAVRADVLARIERRRVPAEAAIMALLQTETDPLVKGAAIRTWCALGAASVVPGVIPYLDDSDLEVRHGVLTGLLQYGGMTGIKAAGDRLIRLARAPSIGERHLAAQAIGEAQAAGYAHLLHALLEDEELIVRQAALLAAGRLQDRDLLPLVVAALRIPATRSTAMTALETYGGAVLPLARTLLQKRTGANRDATVPLVRLCAHLDDVTATDLLLAHLDHPDAEIRQAVLSGLHRRHYRAKNYAVAAVRRQLKRELSYGAHVLQTQADVGDSEAAAHLQRALDQELEHARQRAFLLLSFIYDSRAMLRAEARLLTGSTSDKALVLEFLEVTLAGVDRQLLMPLLTPGLSTRARAEKLSPLFALSPTSLEQRLQEIIANESGVWSQPWLAVCAVYVSVKMSCASCRDSITGALSHENLWVRETASWACAQI